MNSRKIKLFQFHWIGISVTTLVAILGISFIFSCAMPLRPGLLLNLILKKLRLLNTDYSFIFS